MSKSELNSFLAMFSLPTFYRLVNGFSIYSSSLDKCELVVLDLEAGSLCWV